jgi:hypothetical protein
MQRLACLDSTLMIAALSASIDPFYITASEFILFATT